MLLHHPLLLIKSQRSRDLRKSKAQLTLVEEYDFHGHLIHRWKRDGVEHIERVADKLAFIDHGEPIASVQGNEIPPDTNYKVLKEIVAEYWTKKYNNTARNKILGEVTVDKKAAGFAIGHGMNHVKSHAMFIIPEVIEKGVVLGELPHVAPKPRAFVIAAPVSIAGEHYKMLVEVRRDPNMQRLYLYEVILRKKSPSSAFINPAASPLKEAEPQVATRGAIYSLLQSLRQGKMSKSRDAAEEIRISFTYIKLPSQNDDYRKSEHPMLIQGARRFP